MLSPAVLASYLMFLAVFVNWFILPFYVSNTLKVDAKSLGFLLMLMPAVGAIAALWADGCPDRFPPAYLTTLALAIVSGGMFWLGTLSAESTVAQTAVRMVGVGVGIGLFQAANATLIMSAVPGDRLGTGGAILFYFRGPWAPYPAWL